MWFCLSSDRRSHSRYFSPASHSDFLATPSTCFRILLRCFERNMSLINNTIASTAPSSWCFAPSPPTSTALVLSSRGTLAQPRHLTRATPSAIRSQNFTGADYIHPPSCNPNIGALYDESGAANTTSYPSAIGFTLPSSFGAVFVGALSQYAMEIYATNDARD